MSPKRLWRNPTTGPELNQSDDAFAKTNIGDADHDGIRNVRVVLQRGLHFVGEDLLSAGVDAQRAAAEHDNGPITLNRRKISRESPTLTATLDERRRGFGRITKLPHRHMASPSEMSDNTGAGQHRLEVVI